jgi:regulator of sigma E protease
MSLLSAIVLLGILIFVHELGHFLIAKLLGVKVLKFSLGFGPKIIGKKYGDTEYLLSAVPLGGYVKMLGQSDVPSEEEEISEAEKHRAYNFQPVWKRFSIVFFGPLFNLFFAAFVFFWIFLSGVPAMYPDVGQVLENSSAQKSGLMTGDRIIEINGKAIISWDEIEDVLDKNPGKTLSLKVKRGDTTLDFSVTPEMKKAKDLFGESKDIWDIGITPLVYPAIGSVMKGSRAEKAGLKKGDRIISIEDTELKTWPDMTGIIHNNPEKPLKFKIQRGAEITELVISPEKSTVKTPGEGEKVIGLIGIKPEGNDFIRKYGLLSSISLGVMKTWDVSVLTVVSIVKLFQRVIPADTIGGPIMIVQMAGEQASQGFLNFFTLMAVISVNLGILNLLPIPVLDGGHLMFMSIEAVRRKPVSEKVAMAAQKVGIALLVTLMVFALYNDIMRLITKKMMP